MDVGKKVISIMKWLSAPVHIYLANPLHLQIPFVVVTAGPEPVTRSAKLTIFESAFERKFHTDDFKNIDRKGTGVVLSYNSMNHYCPTVIISQRDFVSWQLQCVGRCLVPH